MLNLICPDSRTSIEVTDYQKSYTELDDFSQMTAENAGAKAVYWKNLFNQLTKTQNLTKEVIFAVELGNKADFETAKKYFTEQAKRVGNPLRKDFVRYGYISALLDVIFLGNTEESENGYFLNLVLLNTTENVLERAKIAMKPVGVEYAIWT